MGKAQQRLERLDIRLVQAKTIADKSYQRNAPLAYWDTKLDDYFVPCFAVLMHAGSTLGTDTIVAGPMLDEGSANVTIQYDNGISLMKYEIRDAHGVAAGTICLQGGFDGGIH